MKTQIKNHFYIVVQGKYPNGLRKIKKYLLWNKNDTKRCIDLFEKNYPEVKLYQYQVYELIEEGYPR